MALAEDVAKQQAIRKGKVVITDYEPTDSYQSQDHSAIMVLEETGAAPSRPVELITPQPGGGSGWFIQHKPRLKQVGGQNNTLS